VNLLDLGTKHLMAGSKLLTINGRNYHRSKLISQSNNNDLGYPSLTDHV